MDAAQQTLSDSIQIAGVGLMLGIDAVMTLKPAPPNTGVVFARIDLPNRPEIPVNSESEIAGAGRSAALEKDGARVQTIEHLLSALAGMGVDNCVVEINAPEPPIGDGSALHFVEAVAKTGLETQDAPRRFIEIDAPLGAADGDRSVSLFPDDRFRAGFVFDKYNRKGVENQTADFHVTPEIYAREIAPARTFCFADEVAALQAAGLGKGANDDNVLVIDDRGLRNGKFRFENELARHKLLDLIGDLSLAGAFPRGYALAVRSQHALNHRLAQQLRSRIDEKRHRLDPPMGPVEIEAAIPHRYPFLLVDRIVSIEEGKRITGVKSVSYNEPFFRGHFPGHPVMPGVLIVEALAQTAGVLVSRHEDFKDKIAYFMTMNNVKFRGPAVPGDQIVLKAEATRLRRSVGYLRGTAYIEGKLIAEADFSFALADRGNANEQGGS